MHVSALLGLKRQLGVLCVVMDLHGLQVGALLPADVAPATHRSRKRERVCRGSNRRLFEAD
jgi:hypothetical protein